MRQGESVGDCFYGSVTVGERGQIVIPLEARTELGYKPGDKLLVMRHPLYEGLMVAKFESLKGFLDELSQGLRSAQVEAVGEPPGDVP
jgi:AbrB family looped-hinge helix DNA binding protein